jgi:hypothetical protein
VGGGAELLTVSAICQLLQRLTCQAHMLRHAKPSTSGSTMQVCPVWGHMCSQPPVPLTLKAAAVAFMANIGPYP